MKVKILPKFAAEDKGDGGIRRIVEAQERYLPRLGIEIVDTIEEADIVHTHAGDQADVPIGKPWVHSCHGLYWAEYEWWDWAYKLNQLVIESMRRADHVTAPSEWVAQVLRRGMWLRPTVLYHGIDPDGWTPAESQGYVLWNKTRTDPICDPKPVDEMAKNMPQVQFLTTFGNARPNVKVTGRLPFEQARQMLAGADVYLATTRETMGIGTLEAMACGVPVLGYNWGGQREIIEHQVTGYLVEPGNVLGLIEGYHWLMEHRKEVGSAARDLCLSRFTWPKVMEQYAELYQRLLAGSRKKRPKVSVVMPCYNLARYLPAAVKSVLDQTMRDWELIIVDDASPDDTPNVAREYQRKDKRIRYLRNEQNLYLAGALNAGIAAAKGRYILPLDADNMITPGTLAVLSDYLDQHRETAIAYGRVQFVTDGLEPDKSVSADGISSWPPEFDYLQQIKHRNQIPSTCMYRRSMWERTGGYRTRWKTAEDAAFWTHATSYGHDAKLATEMVTLVYRNRHDSMSHTVKEPDWTAWVPWAKHPELTPFGAPVKWGKRLPNVPTCEPSVITVVIPVGPGHERIVIDALDSVEAQTFRSWDVIVVNDTGGPLGIPHPWARILDTSGPVGVATARNLGIAASRTETFVLLDADDILDPDCLETFWTAYQDNKGKVIYSQWYDDKGTGGTPEVYDPPSWDPDYLLAKGCVHAITALYPRKAWEAVGGFDPAMTNWEDWEFQIALAAKNICGCKVPQPLWTYRKTTGRRRQDAFDNYQRGRDEMMAKWGQYFERRARFMGCGGCTRARAQAANPVVITGELKKEGAVLVEYVGRLQTITVRGKETGKNYKFGLDIGHRRRWVWAADSAEILRMGQYFKPAGEEKKVEPVLR